MKVILLQDVKKIGKKDEIVNVADGYATNYLIPNKLAVQASSAGRKILKEEKQDREKVHQQKIAEAKEIAKKLEDIVIEFDIKAGTDGRVFGSVSTKQIENALNKKHNIKLDRRKFKPNQPLRAIGLNRIEVVIYDTVVGTLTVKLNAKE